MKTRDQFIKIVEWSEADQCYVGSIPGFLGPCCHGEDEQKVYRELCQILDEWLLIHQREKLPLPVPPVRKSYSGRFILRIDKELHKLLAIKAAQSNLSLNQLCENLLREAGGKKG